MSNVEWLIPKKTRETWIPDADLLSTEMADMVEIPLMGSITAGQPIDRVADEERISVPQNMVKRDSYALRVKGHSMIDDNIQDGDVVIIEKTVSAVNGQSVVALINDEQVTLKKFYIEKEGIRLQPANPEMKPIYLGHDEVQVLGVVTGVLRQYA